MARVELGMDSALACPRICDRREEVKGVLKNAAGAYIKGVGELQILFSEAIVSFMRAAMMIVEKGRKTNQGLKRH